MKEQNNMISQLDHNCFNKCLDETREQDTAFEIKTKTKTVKILSPDETVSRNFPSLPTAAELAASEKVRLSRQIKCG